jgi:serine/threonine-protein kinase
MTEMKQNIPGYKLLDRLGSGGQGNIYKAVQVSMNRHVAVKVIPPDRQEVELGRFMREARVLARLRHENIVQAIDHGEANGYRYLVMEYIEGKTVLQLIEEDGALGLDRALDIALQLCGAVEHAAELSVMHRDIKPANIVITKEGRAILVDFGLARPEKTNMSFTMVGTSIGTPHYMPPEQILGEGELDARVDIYALGATLYHMVTGRVPFPKASRKAILGSHLWEPIMLPDDLGFEVPELVIRVIEKSMEKERKNRYESAREMAEGIKKALDMIGERPKKKPPPADPKIVDKVWDLTSKVEELEKDKQQLEDRLQSMQKRIQEVTDERDLMARRMRDLTRDPSPMVSVGGEFMLDLHPVTNRRYLVFVKETGHPPPRHWEGDGPPPKLMDHPVVWVTWQDAEDYAAWCGRRLPTAREWQAAGQGDDIRTFPWGDDPNPKRCNCEETGIGETTPVGRFPGGVAHCGALDLGGNTAEWVEGSFSSSRGEKLRAACGGSFKDPLQRSKCDSRRGYPEGGKDLHVGFRCAQDIEAI